MVFTTPAAGSVIRPRCTSPSHAFSTTDQHQQVPGDVDDDVTTTTSGSYVIDMTENGGDWRREFADIYEGVLV